MGNLHEIVWRQDLLKAASLRRNAVGRSGVYTTEGTIFPQSVIVAGYGKTQQILRRPFRSYYSEVDRLVSGSDCLLCLKRYGFADDHLNAALNSYRDSRNRPVVIVDFAPDEAMSAAHADWEPERSVNKALGTFKTDPRNMNALRTDYPSPKSRISRKPEAFGAFRPGSVHTSWRFGTNGMEEAVPRESGRRCSSDCKRAQDLLEGAPDVPTPRALVRVARDKVTAEALRRGLRGASTSLLARK